MTPRASLWAVSVAIALTTSPLAAQPVSEGQEGGPQGQESIEPEEPTEREPDEATIELSNRIDELEARLQSAERSRKPTFPVKLSGYGDIGFFATEGDGAGFRRDIGHVAFPDRADYAWVFYGDLLATQINTRGDAADLGDAPGVDRFDSVHSRGNPTFLVNELNLTVNAGLGENARFESSLNFTPRSGTEFRFGDSFDLDLAQLEYMPTAKTSIFVGKVDSVLGIEYKARKSPQRFGITPSLLARYTVGTAVGLKARSKLLNDFLIVSAALTNGSFATEQFHFNRELDTNTFKTVSGRVAVRIPIGSGSFEAGPSGSWGTQDGAPDGTKAMWFAGVDAELDLGRLDIKAQFLRGRAPGEPVSMTYALDLKSSGYVEADVILTPVIGILGRAEFRDAEVSEAMSRLYITKNWRATAGFRLLFNPHTIVKAEVSHAGEYGGVPSIPDDLVTTSAVIAF